MRYFQLTNKRFCLRNALAVVDLCTIGVTYLKDSHRFIVEDNKRDIYSFYLKYKDIEEHKIEKLSDNNDRIFNYYDRDIIG